MKYMTNTKLRFHNAKGQKQEIPEGSIVSFEEGDQVDIGFLLMVGAIVEYKEPKVTEPEDAEMKVLRRERYGSSRKGK